MINGEGKLPPKSTPPEDKTRLNKQDEPVRAGRAQRGMERLELPRVTVETLRKLNHAEWLDNFARVMQLKTGVEMTPTRQGVIGRLGLAAEYIRLMEHELRKLQKNHDDALALIGGAKIPESRDGDEPEGR